MQEDHYTDLLYKKLTGTLEEVEQQALEQWLADSPDHRRLAEGFEKAWQLSSNFNPEPTLDLEADYNLLQQRIAQSKTTDPPKPKAQIKPLRLWLRVAAALALLLVATFLLRPYFTSTTEWQTVATAADATKEITLPDGSTVWLNQQSTLRYPTAFNGKERQVELEGEAFFDVQKNPAKPFIIETALSEVRVLGTSFNVRHYPQETTVEVQVKTGKVKMAIKDRQEAVILEAEDLGVYNTVQKSLTKQKMLNPNAFGWHSGELRFRSTPLSEVLKSVERMYDIKVSLADTNLNNCPFNNTFSNKTASNVLSTIAAVFNMQLEADTLSATYILKGGNCQ